MSSRLGLTGLSIPLRTLRCPFEGTFSICGQTSSSHSGIRGLETEVCRIPMGASVFERTSFPGLRASLKLAGLISQPKGINEVQERSQRAPQQPREPELLVRAKTIGARTRKRTAPRTFANHAA